MQGLILFALLVTVAHAATTIDFFQAYEPKADNHFSGIYDTHVQLWANVIDCALAPCECKVNVNELKDEPQPFPLRAEGATSSSIIISNLKPNQSYSFTLICGTTQAHVSQTLTIKTDYGRPLPPQNVNGSLVAGHLVITWSPPSIPSDSFTDYELKIDNKVSVSGIAQSQTSHTVPEAYTEGVQHTFQVKTCYKNNQKKPVCSNPEDATGSFFIPATAPSTSASTITTTTATTTTTTTSSGVETSSICIATILSSLLLLIAKMF